MENETMMKVVKRVQAVIPQNAFVMVVKGVSSEQHTDPLGQFFINLRRHRCNAM